MVAVGMREENCFKVIGSQPPKQREDGLLAFIPARSPLPEVDSNNPAVGKLEQRTIPLTDIHEDHTQGACRGRWHSPGGKQKRQVPPEKRHNSQPPGKGRPEIEQGKNPGHNCQGAGKRPAGGMDDRQRG
jgi:hypothetical protein